MAARAPDLRRARRRARGDAPRRAAVARARLRVPPAALVCALVATLNAAAWSIVTPPFQVPDEQSHYAYAEYLVAHGRPPSSRASDAYSGSENAALGATRAEAVHFVPGNAPIWSAHDARQLARVLDRARDTRGGNGAAREVGSEPPLYYALQTIAYRLAAGGDVLDRLQLMRLLSALLAGVTVLFTYLFLRELLPGRPWSWTVGALGVAFQPLFAFISGGVNSDALLYAASAAVFYLLARGFRRGLTPRLAVALGAATATGLMTKFNAFGLLPGVAFGLLALAIRAEGVRVRALRLPLLALAVALAPTLLELALNATVWGRPALGAAASNYGLHGNVHPTPWGGISYAWQFYAIPLPGQDAPLGPLPPWESWFGGFVGLFGWIDTQFPRWVYWAALGPFAALVALAASAFARSRTAVRRRRVELLVYALTALAMALFVAAASYVIYLRYHQNVAQARYLLPLLPLYAGVLALATRALGARWMPIVGCTIVALAIAHDVFAQLLVVSRYYS